MANTQTPFDSRRRVPDPVRLRSVFISDVHLGYRGCNAQALGEFLKSVQTDYLFLVGDIIDLWSLKKRFFWPQAHSDVLRAILGKTQVGTRVIFIPGNHDALFRELAGSVFGNLEIHKEYIHTTATGRRLLVLHGDEFDDVVHCNPLLLKIGTALYDFFLRVNGRINWVRRKLGFADWLFVAHLKNRTKEAVSYMQRFEAAAASAARDREVDGIVCGHIHRPELRELQGVLYCNDGDWVEHRTSLVEDMHGSLSLLQWQEMRAPRFLSQLSPASIVVSAAARAA